MITPTVRVNGRVFTRNSVSVRPNGAFRLSGVDSVDWSDEVPTELVNAMNEGGAPLGKAQGPYACAAQLSIYLDEVANFEAQILVGDPLALGSLAAATFQLPIIMREDVRVHSVVLVNCNIKGRAVTVGNDGSALVKQYTLQPTLVIENGISLARLTPAL